MLNVTALCAYLPETTSGWGKYTNKPTLLDSHDQIVFFIKNNVIVLGGNVSHPHLRNKIKFKLVDILNLLVSRGKNPGGGSRDS